MLYCGCLGWLWRLVRRIVGLKSHRIRWRTLIFNSYPKVSDDLLWLRELCENVCLRVDRVSVLQRHLLKHSLVLSDLHLTEEYVVLFELRNLRTTLAPCRRVYNKASADDFVERKSLVVRSREDFFFVEEPTRVCECLVRVDVEESEDEAVVSGTHEKTFNSEYTGFSSVEFSRRNLIRRRLRPQGLVELLGLLRSLLLLFQVPQQRLVILWKVYVHVDGFVESHLNSTPVHQ